MLVALITLGVLASWTIYAGSAQALPQGMHYELVSPAEVGGTSNSPYTMSPDGSRIQISGGKQGFGGTTSMFGLFDGFVSSRTASGWTTTPLNPPATPDLVWAKWLDSTPDLSDHVFGDGTVAQYHDSQEAIVLSSMSGGITPTAPVLTDLTASTADVYGFEAYFGASADLGHFVFGTSYTERLLPTDSPARISPATRLYEVSGVGTDAAVLRRVDVEGAGVEIGTQCGATVGGQNNANDQIGIGVGAVSSDGTKVFFSARPGAEAEAGCVGATRAAFPVKLFARSDGSQTTELSASECQRAGCSTTSGPAAFQAASQPDGRVVAFLSSDQLVDSDTDNTEDLYLYDFDKPSGQHLVQASAGGAGDATPGAGAQVQGVVQMAEDGSRVYFVAKGILTTAPNSFGQTAQVGGNNLYMYDAASGQTTFVASLAAGDKALWSSSGIAVGREDAISDPAGRLLLFDSFAPIGPGDTDTAQDLYRFDAQTSRLIQVSPDSATDGTNDNITIPNARTDAHSGPHPSPLSADGSRIVFETNAALSAADTNGAADVYLWSDGNVELVSDGKDPAGVGPNFMISSAGDEIAFSTSRQLVPEDVDTVVSTYVARSGSDVERALVPTTPTCTGDACQGPPGPAPLASPSDSASFHGAGNVNESVRPAISGIQKISASDRSKLAKGGKARVHLKVNRSGTVTVTGTAKAGKKSRRVISASSRAEKAGPVSIPFALSKRGRSALRHQGSLTVTLTVHFINARPEAVTFTLRSATSEKGGRS